MVPLADRVFIRPEPRARTTEAGLLVDDQMPSQSGVVVATGARVSSDLQIGNFVVFSWRAGQLVTVHEETLLVLRESDILVVCEGVL